MVMGLLVQEWWYCVEEGVCQQELVNVLFECVWVWYESFRKKVEVGYMKEKMKFKLYWDTGGGWTKS